MGDPWYEPPGGAASQVGENDRLLIEQEGITKTITPGLLLSSLLIGVAEVIGLRARVETLEAEFDALQAGSITTVVYEQQAADGPLILPVSGSAIVSIPLSDESGDPLIIQPLVEGHTVCGAAEYELFGPGVAAMFVLIGLDWRRVG